MGLLHLWKAAISKILYGNGQRTHSGAPHPPPLPSVREQRLAVQDEIVGSSSTSFPVEPNINPSLAEGVTFAHTDMCSPEDSQMDWTYTKRPDGAAAQPVFHKCVMDPESSSLSMNVDEDISVSRGYMKDLHVDQGNTTARLRAEFEHDKKKLQNELLTAQAQASAAKDDLEKKTNLFDNVKRSNEGLERQVGHLRADYQSQLNRASEELRVLREMYAKLQTHWTITRQDLSVASDTIKQTRKRSDELQDELSQVRIRNGILSKQVQDLEKQRGELVTSNGFFDSSSGPTPSQLQKLANKLRDLLSSFSKKLMTSMRKTLTESNMTVEELGLDLVQGVNFRNKLDVKFAYQKLVAGICFQDFESEDYGILYSLPATLDRDQSQVEYFNQFEALNSLSVAQVYDKVQKFEPTRHVCDSKACLDAGYCRCGPDSFLPFFVSKERNLQYELARILKKRGASDHGFWNATLHKELVQLLTSVWLAHLLSFAFEPPAALFKIRSGHDFDPQYMENVGMMRDENLEDVQQVPKVSFMILPGLRVAKSVIRGLVYVP